MPLAWFPAGDLGDGCPPKAGLGEVDDLLFDPLPAGGGAPDGVLAVVDATGLPRVIGEHGLATETLIVAFPTDGRTDPPTHHWLVLISGLAE